MDVGNGSEKAFPAGGVCKRGGGYDLGQDSLVGAGCGAVQLFLRKSVLTTLCDAIDNDGDEGSEAWSSCRAKGSTWGEMETARTEASTARSSWAGALAGSRVPRMGAWAMRRQRWDGTARLACGSAIDDGR